MIRDKHSNKEVVTQTPTTPTTSTTEPIVTASEAVALNPFVEMYKAVKRAIKTIKEQPNDPNSQPLFKTIAIDNGQYSRIIRDVNMESEVAFPAVFIHFVNVNYLVQQQRIGEGRATMRVRFILNTLNNSDEDMECLPFEVFQRINVAIQDAKDYEEALNERCNLTYFDMPTTSNMLQAFWIDYEVWFREASAFKYRNWVERYVVIPPFTNHSDQEIESNTESHTDHKEPIYPEVSDFENIIVKP